MVKCIREPGRNCSTGEDAVLRTVLSVLSSEEMAMHLPQPSGIGRRPTNVSADSMLVTPELKPEDLYPIRRYMTYTPPPKGYFYESKDQSNSNNANVGYNAVKNRFKPNRLGKAEYREVFSETSQLSPSSNFQGMANVMSSTVPIGGRPICKTYTKTYSDSN